MSVPTPPSSPALSVASDDFAGLLDAELAEAAASSDDDVVVVSTEEEEEEEEDEAEQDEGEERGGEEESNRSNKRLKLDVSSVEKGTCPPHPGFMWGVCIRCGQLKPESERGGEANVALKYIHEEFELAGDELARLREHELRQVLAQKKLFLVLDLDHTLLNSARFIEVSPEETSYIEETYLDGSEAEPSTANHDAPVMAGAIQAGRGGLYKLHGMHLWTKLRPFAHKFLEEASQLFELYVYTMGERTYAVTMAHLLDPSGKFFKGRIISNRDSTRRQSKDLDIVLGAESAVVILDDTEGVWPKHRANLIVMERYHYFTSSCKQFGLQTLSLADTQSDESETEGALANVLNVLKRIHADFFTENDRLPDSCYINDIRDVVSVVRSEILSGCRLVFSRIFPSATSEPELHPLWRLCVDLGAECSRTIDDSVTHVVALDPGTEKANWAKQHGKFLVHPAWVEAAHSLWRRPSEADFPVREGRTKCPVYTFARTVAVDRIMNNRDEAKPKDET